VAPARLHLRVDRVDDDPCLWVAGEIDLATAPELVEQATALVADGPARLLLDFAEVSFLDSSGVAALVSIQQRAATHGTGLAVRGVAGQIRSVLEMTRMGEIMTITNGGPD